MSDQTLIIIDVQNDFCPGGALAVTGGDEIVSLINRLQPKFGPAVLTQDWHPSDHTSFASNHTNKDQFTLIDLPYGPQVLWPTHCVQGSQGAEFHNKLDTTKAAVTIRKGYRPEIDSYSAFFENDHTTPTGLAGYLKDQGVTSLAMVGLATDFCVRYSAVDATKLGFDVTLIEDACRAIDMDGSLAEAMKDMTDHGVRLSLSSDYL